MIQTTHIAEITTSEVRLNGQLIPTTQTGEALLVELYRAHIGDYPKFFKMDTLSRLAFVAAELVLQSERKTENGPADCHTENRKVILANRSASIKNDTDYLQTISGDEYYPSPALFVYTLPNITTGEIAIRNHYFGETCFYVLQDEKQLDTLLETIPLESAIAGWVECTDKDNFYAKIRIIENRK